MGAGISIYALTKKKFKNSKNSNILFKSHIKHMIPIPHHLSSFTAEHTNIARSAVPANSLEPQYWFERVR